MNGGGYGGEGLGFNEKLVHRCKHSIRALEEVLVKIKESRGTVGHGAMVALFQHALDDAIKEIDVLDSGKSLVSFWLIDVSALFFSGVLESSMILTNNFFF